MLSDAPVRVLGSNAVPAGNIGLAMGTGNSTCQSGGTMPQGTTAVRLELEGRVGPTVTVLVLAEGEALARTRVAGWTGGDLTVPIAPAAQATPGVRICFAIGRSRAFVLLIGREMRAGPHGARAFRSRIEYLALDRRSWWSSIAAVARRIGLGRAPGGTWVALLLVALMLAVAALAWYLCMRELAEPSAGSRWALRAPPGRLVYFTRLASRLPAAAWMCMLVACLNAVCWSILSPPFQPPDEPAHFAYVQQLAESHRIPSSSADTFSTEEETALTDLDYAAMQFRPAGKAIASEAQQRQLERDLARPFSRTNTRSAGTAANEPPLYYVLETIPYELASSGTLLDRLELMRLLSALFGGLTALFAYLFVREALPAEPWAWAVGGLGAGLAPLLGFMSGAVHPDALLYTISAALFYQLARAFRRGLTRGLSLAIGVTIALGVLTQLVFLGLLPGALAGVLLASLRTPSATRRARLRRLAATLAAVAAPVLLYVLVNAIASHRPLSFATHLGSSAQHGSISSELSYVWQLYLPRLPGMPVDFPEVFTTRQYWFDGLVGLYGSVETVFPPWVYNVALIPAGAIALLGARALLTARAALRERAAELAVYGGMAVGVPVAVGVASYNERILGVPAPYSEPRYLLPMLVLFAAALALAARGAGRRWGPAVGAVIVMLVLAHDIFSQLLVVSRYYG